MKGKKKNIFKTYSILHINYVCPNYLIIHKSIY